MQEQYLHADGSIDIQIRGVVSRERNEGYNITIDVCSTTSQLRTELYTYSQKEGFYRLHPDDSPHLVELVDGILSTSKTQRNPSDVYEISIEITDCPDEHTDVSKRHFSTGLFPNEENTFVIDELLEKLETWEQEE